MATCGEQGRGVPQGAGQGDDPQEGRACRRADRRTPAAESSELPFGWREREYRVVLDDGRAIVNGVSYAFTVSEDEASSAARPTAREGGGRSRRRCQGSSARIPATAGKSVRAGDVVVVLEAMKMEIEVKAAVSGVVEEIAVAVGSSSRRGRPSRGFGDDHGHPLHAREASSNRRASPTSRGASS